MSDPKEPTVPQDGASDAPEPAVQSVASETEQPSAELASDPAPAENHGTDVTATDSEASADAVAAEAAAGEEPAAETVDEQAESADSENSADAHAEVADTSAEEATEATAEDAAAEEVTEAAVEDTPATDESDSEPAAEVATPEATTAEESEAAEAAVATVDSEDAADIPDVESTTVDAAPEAQESTTPESAEPEVEAAAEAEPEVEAAAEAAPETAASESEPAEDEATAGGIEESKEDEIELLAFADLALPEPVIRAIDDLGFARGTPIQSATLPWSLSDYDVVGQAQTGTGKTAAFLLTIFTRLWENPEEDEPPLGRPRNLVLAPTRELALQIASDAEDLAKYTPFNVLAVVGGIDFDRQLSMLRSEPVDLVIATPGRLIDFIERRVIDLRAVEVLVIDEADRMLDMGFIPDVRRIVYRTPHKRTRQTMFFSATFNDDVHRLADQWTTNPFKVAIAADRPAVDSITQEMYNVSNNDKFKVLYNIITQRELKRVLVFSNRRDSTREVYQRLRALGVDCDMLAGDVPQRKRLATLDRFKEGKIRVLVATDVAGRGLHVEDLSHVINYNLPEDPEDYIHRIGRTGRAGATGNSISLVCEDEGFKVGEIETLLGRPLDFLNPDADLLKPPPRRSRSSQRSRDRDSDSNQDENTDLVEEAVEPNVETADAPATTEPDAAAAEFVDASGEPEPEPQPEPSSAADRNDWEEDEFEDDPNENIGNRIDGTELPPDSIARAFLEEDGDSVGNRIDEDDDGPQPGNDGNSQGRRRRRRRRRRPAGGGNGNAGSNDDNRGNR